MANAPSEDILGLDPAPTRLLHPSRRAGLGPSPLEQLVTAMPRRAAGAVRHDVKAGASLILARPWRIQAALFGNRLGPLPDRVDELIAFADRRRLIEEASGLAGHWTYSFNRHIALKQALLALRFLRRAGIVRLDALW